MTDEELTRLIRLAHLLRPLTPEEAEAEWEAHKDAPPLSDEEAERIMVNVTRCIQQDAANGD